MVVKRRFERIYIMMEVKSYTKYEEFPENKAIFVYGFNYIETGKVDKYLLTGCESDELYEKDKLFRFWSNKFINKMMEKRNFKITGWSFMTLVRKNNFLKLKAYVNKRCNFH